MNQAEASVAADRAMQHYDTAQELFAQAKAMPATTPEWDQLMEQGSAELAAGAALGDQYRAWRREQYAAVNG